MTMNVTFINGVGQDSRACTINMMIDSHSFSTDFLVMEHILGEDSYLSLTGETLDGIISNTFLMSLDAKIIYRDNHGFLIF
jgi:hypothetical protein